jgi:hypothetical protein
MIPKFLVILVFILILYTGRGIFFQNKYILIGLMIIAGLGIYFSDSLYQLVTKKVMTYVQSPEANRLPFISQRWKNVNPHNLSDNTRQKMMYDLLYKHKLFGLSRDEINELLGKSDSTNAFPDWDLKYNLGPVPGTTSPEWLVIKFDENNVVNQFNILKN